MSQESERDIKELAELKRIAERRIEELEAELRLLKLCLEVIDRRLAQLSFKPATEIGAVKEEVFEEPPEREYVLTHRTNNRPLARMYVWRDKLRIVPEQDVRINVNRPPFSTFFLRRVLEDFRRKDLEASERGELEPGKVLRYEVKADDAFLKELIIYNYNNEIRLREIRNSARWTFEKMVERSGT